MNKDTLAHIESIGPEGVLLEISQGKHGQPTSQLREEVEAWLRLKEFERNRSSSASAEAIANEHLRVARQQRKIAIVAMVLSAITAIMAALIGGVLSYSSSSPINLNKHQEKASTNVPSS